MSGVAAAGLASQPGARATAPESSGPARSGKPMKMHVGTQRSPTTAHMLQYFKRHGVNHICGYPPFPRERGYWQTDEVASTRELCEKPCAVNHCFLLHRRA